MNNCQAAMFKDLSSHIHTIIHKVKRAESLVKLIPTNNQVLGILPPAVYNFPPAVYDLLWAFKEKRELESIEMAVTVIVEEYFGFTQTRDNEADTTSSRLEALEAKCSSLSNTVVELQRAIANLQVSNSQPVDYQGTPLHQHSPLPLQDLSAASESINNCSVDQSELVELSAINDLQTNSSEAEQLLILESQTASQSTNSLSVEYTQALELTGEIASTRGSKDIEPGAAPNIQKQSNLELGEQEISIISMTQADLAKRLGVATSTVSRMQSKANFPDWSKQRDPDGIAWVKSHDTKLFYPQSQK